MKGLTFKEIENIINSEELKLYSRWGKHEEIESAGMDLILDTVRNKIINILRENGAYDKNVYVTTYRSKIYICYGYSWGYGNEPRGIRVSVRKKKDAKNSRWSETLYTFDKIEIEAPQRYNKEKERYEDMETIQEYYQEIVDQTNRSNERKENNYIEFKEKLAEAGISGKEFIELMNKYKSLEYKYKEEFAKEIDPERYYMYY